MKQGASLPAFTTFAKWTATIAGKPGTFTVCLLGIFVWALMGPVFGYSDSWQLIINTGTTIITFLMVFLIQNTQNRDSQSLHLKLDELIRVTKGAQNRLLDLEELDDEQLERLRLVYERLGQKARNTNDESSYVSRPEHAEKLCPPDDEGLAALKADITPSSELNLDQSGQVPTNRNL